MPEVKVSPYNKSGSYKIRPAGRHLATIGKELIQNEAAAIIELVKNAYDADADEIYIDINLSFVEGTIHLFKKVSISIP